jgi:hypothetical protein
LSASVDPETLVWNNKPPVPQGFDPLVHQAVPPSKIRIIKDADNKLAFQHQSLIWIDHDSF